MVFHVRLAMTDAVFTVRPDDSADSVCTLLLQHRISGVPVVVDGELVGMITECDLLQLMLDARVENATVADFMTTDVTTVTEDDALPDVANMFLTRGIRRLPVLRGKQLVGIISRQDVVRFVRDLRRRMRHRKSGEPLRFRTQKGIAWFCSISERIVRERMKSGVLPAMKADGEYVLTLEQLDLVKA